MVGVDVGWLRSTGVDHDQGHAVARYTELPFQQAGSPGERGPMDPRCRRPWPVFPQPVELDRGENVAAAPPDPDRARTTPPEGAHRLGAREHEQFLLRLWAPPDGAGELDWIPHHERRRGERSQSAPLETGHHLDAGPAG